MKKFSMTLLSSLLVTSMNVVTYAEVIDSNLTKAQLVEVGEAKESKTLQEDLITLYEMVCQAYSDYGIELDMSLEDFIAQYDEDIYATLEEYAQAYMDVVDVNGSISVVSSGSSSGTTSSEKWYYNTGVSLPQAAVEFCIGEIGSSYKLDLAKDTSSSETDWYCSELNWAAYMNQEIDIEASIGEPGVTPRDITKYSKATELISFE